MEFSTPSGSLWKAAGAFLIGISLSIVAVGASHSEPSDTSVALSGMSGVERQRADELRAAQEAAGWTQSRTGTGSACFTPPSVERLEDGSTRAYLGCDATTGKRAFGPIDANDGRGVAQSLTRALSRALASSAGPTPTLEVGFSNGHASVNLLLNGAANLPFAQARSVEQNLLFTTLSNRQVETVSFLADGHCARFAAYLAMDNCGVIDLTTLASEIMSLNGVSE